ncbi:putative bifunctional diguanylate cyclase/phosphodiesterase [Altererythrobacter sp. MF3-039]|uniref:putative bifunctional diguanylate cyclase/phosphodiesterase n=1 Tax=Altererythrobacter sp. MF3-039 TaxID=3252901 RepID=UPI00390C63B7
MATSFAPQGLRREKLEIHVRSQQVAASLRHASSASVAGCFNALVTAAVFWSTETATFLGFWLAMILLGALARTRLLINDGYLDGDANTIDRYLKWIEALALFNGGCWGIGLSMLAYTSTPAQFTLLAMICSGMMGGSIITYSTNAKAALLFIAPMAAGGVLALWTYPSAPDLSGTLLLGCYMALLVGSARRREDHFMEGIRNRALLQQSRDTIKLLLNDFESQTSDWLWQIDHLGNIELPSQRFGEAARRPVEELDHSDFVQLFEPGQERTILANHITNKTSFRDLTVRIVIQGQSYWWTLSGQPLDDGGMRGVGSDITAQKQAEERVNYMAHYDGLTNLANRFLFNEKLEQQLKNSSQEGELAVMCLDLDGFKTINDTLGHQVGDKLLARVAERIKDVVSEGSLVARLGGDEFVILICSENPREAARTAAAKILDALSHPFEFDGTSMVTATSIGITLRESDDDTAEQIIRRADLALYAAKAAGRNRLAFFEPSMDEDAQTRRKLEMDLRQALARHELELYYQPLINIETGEATSYEALLRWHHPEHGIVMPDAFIPIAEDTGLISQLGEWVLRQACREVALWPSHLRVSVNLSPVQMRDAGLVEMIFSAVATAGIEPHRLELEITENILLHDSEINLAILHRIREFGVRIALDDFGTGYSSLSYLRSFPFDKIKIDKSFVHDLHSNSDSQAIVRAITKLASRMGMETTAEGVEQRDQLDRLRLEGCTEAQGYLFARPQPPAMVANLRMVSENGRISEPLALLNAYRAKPDIEPDGTAEAARRLNGTR